MARPLYISPVGRGGVDFGIQNITRAVRRYGAPRAELLRLPEIYNFIPALIPRSLPRGWWKGFDIIQGRSRVAF
ncbi:MAG: glycosyltransferase family 1 protein, partial [Roseiflexus sp.]|nr:glycosyltransferase family 1 protein [Roseiflexus sp.]